MATITQKGLFEWSQIEKSSELSRFDLILKTIPDERLMQILENERGASGVNKYPIRAVWNSLLAGVVFEHPSIESLRRELKRNPSLADRCGFNIFHGEEAIPTSGCYSRFLSKLISHEKELRLIFDELLEQCYHHLDGFGENLGIDGKAINSYARTKGRKENDRRGDHDASWGKHVSRTESSDGKIYEKVKSWFGYKIHLIADTRYELPVAFTLLPASCGEIPVAHKLIDSLKENKPHVLKKGKYFTADRGYDDTRLNTRLWDDDQIKPVIGIRRSWQDGEETKAFGDSDGVVYDNFGHVYCISPCHADQKRMASRGFEKKRNTLKFACPAEYQNKTCREKEHCKLKKQIRIPLSTDRRIFTPVDRSGYKWKDLYNSRSALERINSRIDHMFGFDNHKIRGLNKMSFKVTLSFVLMLTFALGKAVENKPDEIRKFLSA